MFRRQDIEGPPIVESSLPLIGSSRLVHPGNLASAFQTRSSRDWQADRTNRGQESSRQILCARTGRSDQTIGTAFCQSRYCTPQSFPVISAFHMPAD